MTMAFVVMAFGTIFSGLVMRRDPESGLAPPILRAVGILAIPALITVLAVELPGMQRLPVDPIRSSSVNPVAHQGMPDVRHVHPDLMGAACFQRNFQ